MIEIEFGEEARKERQKRKRAEFNCVKLKLIELRKVIDKEEQHVDELIRNLHRCEGEFSAIGLKEQEAWVLIEQCCRVNGDLNDSKRYFAAAKNLIDRFIERYDTLSKTHVEWMPPPLVLPNEIEYFKELLKEIKDKREETSDNQEN